ncbi:MAG: hypothetical protein P0Y53_10880 [Candidatus Pseudobacter hemicellulosilyticus]|uniref:Uncharacterized protein n=1 Tax=Candidatus Pseudobacter hemicellulosilyticus TaxID=3121375 RepID=A0AAJ5WV67_9BACT|nr:MAG: hypothetical protein P0Y53_10880 [Pseudobacter sp.]
MMVLAVTVLSATKADAQTPVTKWSLFSTSITFPRSTSNSTLIDQLNVVSNWGSFQTTSIPSTGSSNLRAISVSYDASTTNSPDIDATSLQNFYNALKAYYIAAPNTFPVVSPSTFTISATVNGSTQTYTIEVTLR